jgi:hypothetical protein
MGLVAAAVRPDPEPARWEQGLAWIPERCATDYELVPWCGDPAGGYTPPRPGAAYYRPVALRIADQCSTLNGPVDYERVRRVADAQAPWIIARELWDGAGSAADPYTLPSGGSPVSNAYLASTDAQIVGGSATTAHPGLGRLEQAAMEATHGQPVMIHVPLVILPELSFALRVVNNTLYSHAGNVIVADAGYPGTGPNGQTAGATVWMYATPPVSVLMSPWDLAENDTWQVDRATNTRTVWATRLFAATFDPCALFATEITV